MNALGLALDSYLAVRRALGFKLDTNEHLLRNFVEYAQQQHSSIVTTALALDWAIQSNNEINDGSSFCGAHPRFYYSASWYFTISLEPWARAINARSWHGFPF